MFHTCSTLIKDSLTSQRSAKHHQKFIFVKKKSKIKPALSSRYYAEACNEWRIHLCCLAPGLHRNIAAIASRWRHCVRSDRPGIEPQTFLTDSNVFNHSANRSPTRNWRLHQNFYFALNNVSRTFFSKYELGHTDGFDSKSGQTNDLKLLFTASLFDAQH